MNGHPQVISSTHQGVTTIEFYSPQSNSLPGNILQDLAHEIYKAGIDFNTKVIVLRSSGDRAFCAGASFSELTSIRSEEEGLNFFSGFAQVINAMRKCPKMIIARVQGKCVGGGVGIVAAADYAIALDGAEVKLSELSLGFGPFVIGPAVERKIGLAHFSALAIDATQWRSSDWALRKGLFTEVHRSAEQMDEAVTRMAGKLAQFNSDAMAELKAVLWTGTDHWDHLLKERAAISGRLVLSPIAQEAISKVKK